MVLIVDKATGRIRSAGRGRISDVAGTYNREIAYAVEAPDQEIVLTEEVDGFPVGRPKFYPADVRLFTPEELALRIDAETDKAIGATLHPAAPIGEQFGILRDQLVQILNALGMEATAEFAKLNEVAIAAIEAGRAKKEAESA